MSAQVEDAIRAKDHYTRQEIIAIRFPSNYPSIELNIHPIAAFYSLSAASNYFLEWEMYAFIFFYSPHCKGVALFLFSSRVVIVS